jgi:hypothetical protein
MKNVIRWYPRREDRRLSSTLNHAAKVYRVLRRFFARATNRGFPALREAVLRGDGLSIGVAHGTDRARSFSLLATRWDAA